MFNSDDCGPLTENSGSLSSIKRQKKKKGRVGGGWLEKKCVKPTDKNNEIVIRCICVDEEKPSDDCFALQARAGKSRKKKFDFCIPPIHLCPSSLTLVV